MKVKLNNSERMGVFGLSWPEKVAKHMHSGLKGTGYESILTSFWGAGGTNTGLVKNLHNVYTSYIASGVQPPVFNGGANDAASTGQLSKDISTDTATPEIVAMQFLRSIYDLTRSGVIDYKLYDPVGYKETIETIEQIKPKTGVVLVAEKTGEVFNKVLIVGGLAAGAYLLANLTKLIKR